MAKNLDFKVRYESDYNLWCLLSVTWKNCLLPLSLIFKMEIIIFTLQNCYV